MSAKLYSERDPMALEPYFSQHMAAMTAEGLHSKAAIAAELAFRDARIAALEAYAKSLEETGDSLYTAAGCFGYGVNEREKKEAWTKAKETKP